MRPKKTVFYQGTAKKLSQYYSLSLTFQAFKRISTAFAKEKYVVAKEIGI